jgi:glutathione synthase/RimK-type ligase-like ATP-grasp enzyme
MFLRLMDDRLLPGVAGLPPGAPERARSRRLHELVLRFADLAPGRILNRPTDSASNHSKPYQAQLIRAAGFDIPETLITNEPATAREFMERTWSTGGNVIYKSVSGVRSIVRRVEERDLARLDRIRWCPTQFQRQVAGTDIRVHVVDETALAASIVSEATDYRYAARDAGAEPEIAACELDADVRTRCIALARRLNLPLAGIDLRLTPEGRHVCFEVNPSPAFSFYERRAGLPIASTIARYLAGEIH